MKHQRSNSLPPKAQTFSLKRSVKKSPGDGDITIKEGGEAMETGKADREAAMVVTGMVDGEAAGVATASPLANSEPHRAHSGMNGKPGAKSWRLPDKPSRKRDKPIGLNGELSGRPGKKKPPSPKANLVPARAHGTATGIDGKDTPTIVATGDPLTDTTGGDDKDFVYFFTNSY